MWINCWDCSKQIKVPDIGRYSYKQICPECKAERAKKWEEMLAKAGMSK